MSNKNHTENIQFRKFLEHYGQLIFPLIAIIGAMVFSALRKNPIIYSYLAFGCLVLGLASLFVAKLPMYRSRQFLTVGPDSLPEPARKWYKLAYWLIIPASLVLATVYLILAMAEN